MPNDVAHFAIHADDCQRAKRFYEEMFGWTLEPWGPPDVWRAHTSPGGTHGARKKRRAAVTGIGVTAFEYTIAAEDVAATGAAIETHGGQLTMQPFEIKRVGILVMFKDTERNTVGAMQYPPGIRLEPRDCRPRDRRREKGESPQFATHATDIRTFEPGFRALSGFRSDWSPPEPGTRLGSRPPTAIRPSRPWESMGLK